MHMLILHRQWAVVDVAASAHIYAVGSAETSSSRLEGMRYGHWICSQQGAQVSIMQVTVLISVHSSIWAVKAAEWPTDASRARAQDSVCRIQLSKMFLKDPA